MSTRLGQYVFHTCVVLISCALILSFGIHSVETHHTHPGQGNHAHDGGGMIFSLAEYAHSAEKKAWALIISTEAYLALALFAAVATGGLLLLKLYPAVSPRHLRGPRTFDISQSFFSDGILNPKLFS